MTRNAANSDSERLCGDSEHPTHLDNDARFKETESTKDLNRRSVRGGVITLFGQACRLVLSIGGTAVLARLLTPADFGLIAMCATITGFAAIFKDVGLTAATIQRKSITHAQTSTLFWINAAIGFILMLGVGALAPAVGWFYGEPRLVVVLLAISSSFVFGGLAAQHIAVLRREMRYTELAVIDVGALAVSFGTAIALASAGAGYWALAAQPIVLALGTAVGAWVLCRWLPSLPVRGAGVRSMLAFGSSVTGFNVLNYLSRNMDNVLIGWRLGASPLGIYSRAYGLVLMPIRQINAPVSSVVMTALSRLQDDADAFRVYYLRAIAMLAFVTMPLIALAFATADEIVLILLGDQWTQAADVFRLLAPAAFVGAVNVAPGWLCMTLGRPERQLRWAMIAAPVSVTGFVIGLRWGISGIATAFSITFCIMFVVFVQYACVGSPVRARNVWMALWRPSTAAIGSAAGTMVLVQFIADTVDTVIGQFAERAVVFGALYLGTWMCLPGGAQLLRRYIRMMRHLRSPVE